MAGDGKAPEQGLSARGLSAHILPTSATMVGVCMTVLSIGHLAPRGEVRVAIDKLLAVDAIVFLVSAVLSFMSLRPGQSRLRYEWWGELLFICGLALLALGAVVLAFIIN